MCRSHGICILTRSQNPLGLKHTVRLSASVPRTARGPSLPDLWGGGTCPFLRDGRQVKFSSTLQRMARKPLVWTAAYPKSGTTARVFAHYAQICSVGACGGTYSVKKNLKIAVSACKNRAKTDTRENYQRGVKRILCGAEKRPLFPSTPPPPLAGSAYPSANTIWDPRYVPVRCWRCRQPSST